MNAEYIIDSFEEAFREWDNKVIDHISLAWSIKSCQDLRAELTHLRALASLVPGLVEALEIALYEWGDIQMACYIHPIQMSGDAKLYKAQEQTLAHAREVMEADNDRPDKVDE